MSIRIVTDSNCDLPQAVIDKYAIAVIPLYINIGSKSYLDVVELSHAQFYEGLPDFEAHPTTSVPGPGAFIKVYQRLASEGATEILSIHISEGLSAMMNSARLAAEQWSGVPVTVFDSTNLTLGTGLQVLAAARAVAEGRSMTDIVEMLQDLAARTYCFAALDTVEFLRRSGRLTRFQWGLASILQIKPLLKMHSGEPEMERVRTTTKAVGRLLELITELGPLEELAVVHSHALDKAEALRQQARHLFPSDEAPLFAEVTPVIGAHIGPGAVGFVAIKAQQ